MKRYFLYGAAKSLTVLHFITVPKWTASPNLTGT